MLAVVAMIGGTGAWLLQDGGGDGSAAMTPGPAAAEGSPSPWTILTPGAVGAPSDAGLGSPSPSPSSSSSPSMSPSMSPSTVPTAAVSPGALAAATAAIPAGIPAADRRAGIATTSAARTGTGRLSVVAGQVPAPGAGQVLRVRVEVEEGIGADGTAFAAFVMSTLNDSRGWAHAGRRTFARTDGPADLRVILASPDTTAYLCGGRSSGTTSCGAGDRAVITMSRWLTGISEYGSDQTSARQQIVNHEVGHVLGSANAFCTPGRLAPVMVEQEEGLHGCRPNAWPFP